MTGIQLRTWRHLHNHTQSSLADALGLRRLTIIRWESSTGDIPLLASLAIKWLDYIA